PEVVSGSNKALGQEGCLSVPDYYAEVERYTSVVVSALDRTGQKITIESDDFLAIVMQHEIDHLSPLKRQMAMKKVKKYVKSHSQPRT
ncbi:peptide deformylase, partial [Vibrio metschnikovii]|uniref:peptide deformylase n=1 Tax=Vibrio metschnikovii TaxID=28172 RepID=UPI001C301E62